jgi:xylan 1,4-beta-xylosidase
MRQRLGTILLFMSCLLGAPATAHAQAAPRVITVDIGAPWTPRDRLADFSIGSDYPGTLLRNESLAQLRVAQSELGFRYIRFHGVFHDGMGVYSEVDGTPVYDFSRIDQLYGHLLSLGLKPFVELGFTPDAMKTSNQTLFYWKGNTSHPHPAKWDGLVDAFVRHLIDRYGVEEVRTWYFEVWNEPNLKDFWEGADQSAYFDLYGRSARIIKSIDSQLRVGGPATAGAAWVPEFIAYADSRALPIDFISAHTYGVEGGFLDETGEGDTKVLRTDQAIVADVRRLRAEIEGSSRPGLPLFFTEWSVSYSPRDAVHDDYISAAYIVEKLHQVEGVAQGMSYWTYSDLFEEPGPQQWAFEGGFGLMTPNGIRKPSWFAFKYLNTLGEREWASNDAQAIVAADGKTLQVLAWTFTGPPEQDESNRPFYRRVRPAAEAAPIQIAFTGLAPGRRTVNIRRVGFRNNDAYTAYLEMGRPQRLTPDQIEALQTLSSDPVQSTPIDIGRDGRGMLALPMRDGDVVLVEMPNSLAPSAS